MGHRALVAVERDGFDCYRSQWAGLAVARARPDSVVDRVVTATDPVVTGVPASGVLSALDPRMDEALFVRADGETATYLVCRVAVPSSRADGDSWVVLVPVADAETADRLDCVFRTLKGVLGDAVDAGLLDRAVAVGYLTSALARHPDLPAGTVWLAPEEVGPM
ncbi:hypothetical protein BRC64_02910 [Halobacteriales archaeon QH_10_67_22]|nr:MAG: hypothetical protein BRC64_02910 [Halobacteriales archaeon QH_10_67_22]